MRTDVVACIRWILEEEEKEEPDWPRIAAESKEIIGTLITCAAVAEIPNEVYHFLDDSDIRMKDPDYGRYQRNKVRSALGFGRGEYSC